MRVTGASGDFHSIWIPVRNVERRRLLFRYNPIGQEIEIKDGGKLHIIRLQEEAERFFASILANAESVSEQDRSP